MFAHLVCKHALDRIKHASVLHILTRVSVDGLQRDATAGDTAQPKSAAA
jgi:predicted Zn-dependent protease